MLELLKSISTEKKIDFLKVHKYSFIDLKKDMIKQPICLSYGVKLNEHAPLVSYGNFMCIVGASKSYKSFLKSALIAGYIGGNSKNYFNELRGHNEQNKFIIDIDTEQGEYHVQRTARRVIKMVGSKYSYYRPFALRSLTPKESLQFLEWIFYESDYKNNIGLCTIDSIADLVDNVNDLDKSNALTQKLLEITDKKKCGMITIIHKNYDSLKPTGHLGSAILKKAETVLFIDKDGETANVKAQYSRNISIDDFSFTINNEHLPEETGSIF